MVEVTLRIAGMDCAACAPRIDRVLTSLQGMAGEQVNYASGYALLDYDETRLDLATIVSRIERAGFSVPLEEATLSCAANDDASLERASEKLSERLGIEAVRIDGDRDRLVVSLYPIDVDGACLLSDCRSCGVDAELSDRVGGEQDLEDAGRLRMLRTLVASALLTAPLCWSLSPTVQFVLATLVQFGPGQVFYRGAFNTVRGGNLGMDVLVALSTTIIYAYSTFITFTGSGELQIYYLSQCTLMTLLFFGRYFETLARSETSRSIRGLMHLQPDAAVVLCDGDEKTVDISRIGVGEIVVVRTGDRIPVDGVVVEGSCAVDESAFTGESMPVEKRCSDRLFGGTFCVSGHVQLSTERLGRDSALQQVIDTVRRAQSSKAPVQRLADRIASWFVPVVLGIAAAVFCIWYFLAAPGDMDAALLSTCAVLVVACPCALGLATPTAIMMGAGRSAQLGVFFRGGEQLERAHQVDAVVFDKTGTITQGIPDLVGVYATEACEGGRRALLDCAAAVERLSGHPLARVVTRGAAYRHPDALPPHVEDFEEVAGGGVRGRVDGHEVVCGNRALLARCGVSLGALENLPDVRAAARSEVCVARDGIVLGVLGIADRIKPEAYQTVRELSEQGIRTVLVSGDNLETSREIASQAGIDEFVAEVLPDEKADIVTAMRARGMKVAMVGDGINDAPALVASDIAIAMGDGTDVAIDASDIVLLGGTIAHVPLTLRLSHDTIRTIRQNLVWAAFYNALCIPLAACGIMNPVIAAAAMCFSSIAVLANSLRLGKAEGEKEVVRAHA